MAAGAADLVQDDTGLHAPCAADRRRIIGHRRGLIEKEIAAVKRELNDVMNHNAANPFPRNH